jgi:hypothetical protein
MDAWTQALLVTPLRIAGIRLRPFSLAHNAILRANNSPYLCSRPATTPELFFALQVCSRTLEQIRDGLLGPRPPVWRLFFAGLRWRRSAFDTADASFRIHVADYKRYPEREPVASGDEIAAPFEWHAARILCREYGMSLCEAWDTPINMAVCAVDTWTESQGTGKLLSDYDAKLRDLLEKEGSARKSGDTAAADLYDAQIRGHIAKRHA